MIEPSYINVANYPNLGELFLGCGGAIICIAIAYGIYLLAKSMKEPFMTQAMYEQAEQLAVEKFAMKHGLDIKKMIMEWNIAHRSNKFKAKFEQKMIEEMFPEKNDAKDIKK